MPEKKVRRITLSLVVNWLIVVLFIILAFTSFGKGQWVAGISMILAVIIVLPPVNKVFRKRFNFEFSRGLKIGLAIVLLIMWWFFGPAQFPSSTSTTTQSLSTFTDSNFNLLESNPNQYVGSLVNISGQIFNIQQISASGGSFQIYQGGDSSTNVVVTYQSTLPTQPKKNDCVRIIGSVAGQYSGTNAFDGSVSAVQVTASSIQEISCKDVLYPNVTVSITNAKKAYIIGFVPNFGDSYIVVSLNIQNSQNQQLYVSPSYAHIIDSNGAQYDYDSATYSLQNSFQSKNMLPYTATSGDIAFQVPTNATISQFVYELDSYKNVFLKFNIYPS